MNRPRISKALHPSVLAAGWLLLACSAEHPASDDEAEPQHDAASAVGAALGDAQATHSVDAGGQVADAAASGLGTWDASGSRSDAGGSIKPAQSADAEAGAPREASAPGGQDAGEISCTPFPSFDRSCTTRADCSIATRSTDCCGTVLATGIRSTEAARFRSVVSKCEIGQPICDCLAGPARADDGSAASGGTQPQVECISGECWTSYAQLSERTACYQGLTCDLSSEVCVITTSHNGDATMRCARLPTHCQRDRSCACDPSLCGGSSCGRLSAPNTLMCHCTTCP